MRIHGGAWNGRKVAASDRPGLRPLTGRWRQVLSDRFPDLAGVAAADLFAGTGSWGISMLSHGAAHVTFFEASRPGCRGIAAALRELGADPARWEVAPGRLPATLAGREPFGLVACDPPFSRLGLGHKVLAAVPAVLAPSGTLLVRWPAREAPPEPYNLALRESVVHGRESMLFFGHDA